MKLGHLLTLIALCCFAVPSFVGCEDDHTADAGHGDHGHDHGDGHGHDHGDGHGHDHGEGGHDHGDGHDDGELPAHGPNNGHLIKLGGTDMIGEWIHYNDNDIIRVLLLDKKLENAIDYDGVTITPTAGDDKTPFELELDPEKNPEGKKVVYMLEEQKLMLAMSLGVDVEFRIDDKTYSGKIEPHAPHDH